jgi:hypothetical protein
LTTSINYNNSLWHSTPHHSAAKELLNIKPKIETEDEDEGNLHFGQPWD